MKITFSYLFYALVMLYPAYLIARNFDLAVIFAITLPGIASFILFLITFFAAAFLLALFIKFVFRLLAY